MRKTTYPLKRNDVVFASLIEKLRKERLINGIDKEPVNYRRLTKLIANGIRENKVLQERLITAPLIPEEKQKRKPRGIMR